MRSSTAREAEGELLGSARRFALTLTLEVILLLAGVGLYGAAADAPAHSNSRVLRGEVTKVVDGDSIVLAHAEGSARIRLAEVDAPELSQPHGVESRAALRRLVLGSSVHVVIVDRDHYGRLVGAVFVDDLYVSHELVRLGHAWAYTKYSKNLSILDVEQAARAAGRGLWSLPPADRDPPWEWRSRSKDAKPDDEIREPSPGSQTACGTKRFCSEMVSCAEALDHLMHCGVPTLDGDGDGVPCEKLCTQ